MTHKQSRQRDKKIMRIFGEHVSSGSEEIITPEAEWIAQQGYKWSESEEEQQESDGEHDDSDLLLELPPLLVVHFPLCGVSMPKGERVGFVSCAVLLLFCWSNSICLFSFVSCA